MKFEQLLQVYWSKGFYFAGRMRSFNVSLDDLFFELNGLGSYAKYLFIKRFEFGPYKYKKNKILLFFPLNERKIINIYLSQMTGISNDVKELWKYNLIRIYLIKTFKGKAQAFGKPSRGQRTWSNAWTSYKLSTPLKTFITEMKKIYFIKKKPESKNKKILKKKPKILHVNKIKTEKKKINLWF